MLGPLAEFVVDKLTSDYPDVFKRCNINHMRNKEALEQGLQSNAIVDYRRRGSVFECTTIQAIREAKVRLRFKSKSSNEQLSLLELSLHFGHLRECRRTSTTQSNPSNCAADPIQVGKTN